MNALIETKGHVVVNSGVIEPNFAIWLLIQDGLHTPPFDKHQLKRGILQQNGMDADSWNQWLKLIIISNDNRLSWHTENIEEEARKRTESDRLKQILTNNTDFFNELWHSSREREYRSKLQRQEQKYREAVADYSLDVAAIHKLSAPQLWQGNQQSQAIINQMWDGYKSNYRSNPHIDDYFTNNIAEQMQSQLEMDNYASGYRKIYLVPYIAEVSLVVPPISIIITVENAPINAQQLNQRMIGAVQRLETS